MRGLAGMTQNDSFLIYAAGRDDIDFIAKIAALNCENPWSAGQFAEELEGGHAFLFCAKTDGRIVGFADMHAVVPGAHINELAVDDAFRRRGVGKRLVNACAEAAKGAGCETLTLEVSEKNHAARSFYEKLGFFAAGVRRLFYSNPSADAFVMKMELKEGAFEC